MMKSVMNYGATLEEDISNNRVIYLCEKENRWSRCYSDNDRRCYQGCQAFSLDQDDFCNGVFDFPLNDTTTKRDTYNTKYFLSNCNVSEKYDKYRSRYNYLQNNTIKKIDEIKKREKQWAVIKDSFDKVKLYERWILFSDELNCSPYNQILEISLMINISVSVIIGLISLINFVALLKRAKSPDSPIRKFLMNLYRTNLISRCIHE